MEEYFYIIDCLVIILGSLSLVFILGLFTFLCFQRFMWWKHKDFITYRYMKKLSKKDSEEFWEYIDFLKKERKVRRRNEYFRKKIKRNIREF